MHPLLSTFSDRSAPDTLRRLKMQTMPTALNPCQQPLLGTPPCTSLILKPHTVAERSLTLVVLEQGPVALDELLRDAVLVVHPLRRVLDGSGQRMADDCVESAWQTRRLFHLHTDAHAGVTSGKADACNTPLAVLMLCCESSCRPGSLDNDTVLWRIA